VPFHSPDFFLENFVPESRLEFALSQGRGRDTHGFLPTTKQDLSDGVSDSGDKDKIWTHIRLFGAIDALFSGVSVTYLFSSSRVFVTKSYQMSYENPF
jgi:hypothetical protein